ncbi:MAG: energy transducer TonB [Muribaculaceae bacterium]|nr:energy transducer TonB [Muribaculaceae bacterium]
MGKDVDLSSREWCDLVFEGKNKDFGAYVLRTESPLRHNKAVLYTLLGAILLVGIIIGTVTVNNILAERALRDQAEQEEVVVDMGTDEPEDEPEQEKLEQPKPEVLPEEVLNTVKVTELAIVQDDQVKKEDEIKTQDELKETETAFGQKDNDKGTEDRNVTRTLKEEVVVEKKVEPEKKAEPEQIFKSVEQPPTFPGGEAALMKYLSSHIQYPVMAQENNVQGRVVVQFVVEKDGHVGEVKVVRSVDKDLDKEAIRVCKSLPKFTPGRQNGQPVRVWYTLPVNFKLRSAN